MLLILFNHLYWIYTLKLKNIPIRIASFNNFPTAAGLASSASGFAALVYALGKLFVPEYTNNQLSTIARQGSGSACRSLFGGFVAWERGEKEDGSDSNAVEVASKDYWPEIEALICVVNAGKKSVPSTAGMQRTVTTSPYLMHRAENVVPQRMKDISEAIKAKNFDRFAEITMQDSNSFHATCLDTNPPIFYLTDTSRAIINTIHMLNEAAGKNIAAYTFDAGPNAVIYTERKHTNLVLSLINELYEPSNPIDTIDKSANDLLKEYGISLNIENLIKLDKGSLTKIIKTEVGDGPKVISNDNSLLNENGELN